MAKTFKFNGNVELEGAGTLKTSNLQCGNNLNIGTNSVSNIITSNGHLAIGSSNADILMYASGESGGIDLSADVITLLSGTGVHCDLTAYTSDYLDALFGNDRKFEVNPNGLSFKDLSSDSYAYKLFPTSANENIITFTIKQTDEAWGVLTSNALTTLSFDIRLTSTSGSSSGSNFWYVVRPGRISVEKAAGTNLILDTKIITTNSFPGVPQALVSTEVDMDMTGSVIYIHVRRSSLGFFCGAEDPIDLSSYIPPRYFTTPSSLTAATAPKLYIHLD